MSVWVYRNGHPEGNKDALGMGEAEVLNHERPRLRAYRWACPTPEDAGRWAGEYIGGCAPCAVAKMAGVLRPRQVDVWAVKVARVYAVLAAPPAGVSDWRYGRDELWGLAHMWEQFPLWDGPQEIGLQDAASWSRWLPEVVYHRGDILEVRRLDLQEMRAWEAGWAHHLDSDALRDTQMVSHGFVYASK